MYYNMGNRNCAVEGCNALEFRDTGICNRHRGEGIEPWWPAEEEMRIKRELENKRSGGSTLGRAVVLIDSLDSSALSVSGDHDTIGGIFGEILQRLVLHGIGYGLVVLIIMSVLMEQMLS
jgi:hypothetical protein